MERAFSRALSALLRPDCVFPQPDLWSSSCVRGTRKAGTFCPPGVDIGGRGPSTVKQECGLFRGDACCGEKQQGAANLSSGPKRLLLRGGDTVGVSPAGTWRRTFQAEGNASRSRGWDLGVRVEEAEGGSDDHCSGPTGQRRGAWLVL